MSYLDTVFNGTASARVITVTPELARIILNDHNRDNRAVKPAVVKKYARMMQIGDWKLSPETISLSNTGRLLNGQHRLMAVEASGVTVSFLFAYGFDEDVFSVLDRGAARTMSDALGTDKKVSEAGGLLARLAGIKSISGTVSDGDLRRAITRISSTHSDLMGHCNSAAKVFSSAPFRLACVARVMSGESKEYAFDLYRNLVLGHTENIPPVGHAAVRYVLTNKLALAGGQAQMVWACLAWDIFGENMKSRSKMAIRYNAETVAKIIDATGYNHA